MSEAEEIRKIREMVVGLVTVGIIEEQVHRRVAVQLLEAVGVPRAQALELVHRAEFGE